MPFYSQKGAGAVVAVSAHEDIGTKGRTKSLYDGIERTRIKHRGLNSGILALIGPMLPPDVPPPPEWEEDMTWDEWWGIFIIWLKGLCPVRRMSEKKFGEKIFCSAIAKRLVPELYKRYCEEKILGVRSFYTQCRPCCKPALF